MTTMMQCLGTENWRCFFFFPTFTFAGGLEKSWWMMCFLVGFVKVLGWVKEWGECGSCSNDTYLPVVKVGLWDCEIRRVPSVLAACISTRCIFFTCWSTGLVGLWMVYSSWFHSELRIHLYFMRKGNWRTWKPILLDFLIPYLADPWVGE